MFRNVFWNDDELDERRAQRQASAGVVRDRGDEEEYDPYAHRVVATPTSDLGSMAHILKTSLGSGILAMPMAFKHAGLVLGALGTIFVGVVSTHCVQMLVRSSHSLCKRVRVPYLTFSKTAQTAFEVGPERYRYMAKGIGILITVQLLASFILGNSVYVVFMSHASYQIVEHYWSPGVDIRIYTVSLWLPLSLMCMLPNLKSLVPFSVAANLFVLVSFSITLYYIFREIRHTSNVLLIAPFETWPLFLSTVVFAVEGIGTVLPIEREMKHPDHFVGGRCGIVYLAMIVVVTLYTVVGFFGYLEYGSTTQGSVTLNLPINDNLAQTVKILIALAIFFTYALQFYVPITMILSMLQSKVKKVFYVYVSIGVRLGLVSLTMVIALAIPHLEPIIALVGAICFSMLGLLFPALIDIMARYPEYGPWKWRLMKDLIIIFISMVTMLSGLYASAIDIIDTYYRNSQSDDV